MCALVPFRIRGVGIDRVGEVAIIEVRRVQKEKSFILFDGGTTFPSCVAAEAVNAAKPLFNKLDGLCVCMEFDAVSPLPTLCVLVGEAELSLLKISSLSMEATPSRLRVERRKNHFIFIKARLAYSA